MHRLTSPTTLTLVAILAVTTACGGKKPPVANAPVNPGPGSFPAASNDPVSRPPTAPPLPPMIDDAPVVSRTSGNDFNNLTVDAINSQGVLRPIFFIYDSDELDDTARKTLTENAQVLKSYPTWAVTIEGHCDERGTAEYNLALGDRRALVTKNYLQSLGVAADRLRTVSYGKEFPADPAHTETAYEKNRRAQLMVTSK